MARANATLKLIPREPPGEARPDFASIFQSYAPFVASMAGRMTGRSGDVEDIVQDVFFHCARKLETIGAMADAKPWLRTVTVRVVRKRLRRRKWLAWFRSSDDGLTELPYRGLAPDERAMVAALYGALARLPLEERLAWTMRHVEGASLEEAALGCDCSLATVKRRIAKATAMLEEEGHVTAQA